MPHVIILEGGSQTGKSTTFGLLYNLMELKGYKPLQQKRRADSKDLTTILEKSQLKIGLTSNGNSAALLRRRLDSFIDAGCSVIVTALRGSGLPRKILRNYKGIKKVVVPKTTAVFKTNKITANITDAEHLLEEIEKFCEQGRC